MLLVIDKPVGKTSFDMVAQVRRATGVKKVGHSGTLDPLASGVLVIAVGRQSTKELHALMKLDKYYVTKVTLGAFSDTDDAEGPLQPVQVQKKPGRNEINRIIASLTGVLEQIPPKYSALKIGGRRAYALARAGIAVVMKKRKVMIYEIEILSSAYPVLELGMRVGSGTYVRSLARTIGEALHTGGYVSELRRLAVGDFDISQAVLMTEVATLWKAYEAEQTAST